MKYCTGNNSDEKNKNIMTTTIVIKIIIIMITILIMIMSIMTIANEDINIINRMISVAICKKHTHSHTCTQAYLINDVLSK